MASIKINISRLKEQIHFLENEKIQIKDLSMQLESYLLQLQYTSNIDSNVIRQQLDIVNKIKNNIDGRIEFLENLVMLHQRLSDNIMQNFQQMNHILECIDQEE